MSTQRYGGWEPDPVFLVISVLIIRGIAQTWLTDLILVITDLKCLNQPKDSGF